MNQPQNVNVISPIPIPSTRYLSISNTKSSSSFTTLRVCVCVCVGEPGITRGIRPPEFHRFIAKVSRFRTACSPPKEYALVNANANRLYYIIRRVFSVNRVKEIKKHVLCIYVFEGIR